MVRTPREDLERELRDPEFAKLYGAAEAKAEFALTLVRSRRRSEMTQQEMGAILGLSQPYIAKLEGGDANPTLGTAGSLLAVLGLRLVMDTQPLLSDSRAMALVPGRDIGALGVSGSVADIATWAVVAPQELGMVTSDAAGCVIGAGATSGWIEAAPTLPVAVAVAVAAT